MAPPSPILGQLRDRLAQHQRAGRITEYEVREGAVTIRIGRWKEEFSPEEAAWFVACALDPADGGSQPFS